MTDARRPKQGLGRGLSALLGDIAQEAPIEGGLGRSGLQTLPTASLVPHPGQPRRQFDEDALDELAQSIAARGLIQPIVVRPHGREYQIVAGERRWRAAQRARLHEVPVVIRDLDDAQTLEIALVENIQREDLNAIEEARAFQKLADEYGHTQEALAKIVNKSRSHIANLLRLLELPDDVQGHVVAGSLSMGHARALIGASNIDQLAEQVIARGLSVRDTEKLARDKKAPGRGGARPRENNADIVALEHQLSDLLGLSVQISHGASGGNLSINYSTLDQLDMVCQRLTGERI